MRAFIIFGNLSYLYQSANHFVRESRLYKREMYTERDMCLRNTDAPSGNKIKIIAKISNSYILTPVHPKGHGMSVKSEQSMNLQSKFGNCNIIKTLNIALCV